MDDFIAVEDHAHAVGPIDVTTIAAEAPEDITGLDTVLLDITGIEESQYCFAFLLREVLQAIACRERKGVRYYSWETRQQLSHFSIGKAYRSNKYLLRPRMSFDFRVLLAHDCAHYENRREESNRLMFDVEDL